MLVGLYMAYILIMAFIRPSVAPSVPFEGSYDRKFAGRVFLVEVGTNFGFDGGEVGAGSVSRLSRR